MTVLAIIVGAVALTAVMIGLVSPDGVIGDDDTPGPRPTTSPATSAPAAPEPEPTERSSAQPPDEVALGDDDVDWCHTIEVKGSAAASVGKESVEAAACTAVRFLFERRYSRLAIADRYSESDLNQARDLFDDRSWTAVYQPRIRALLAEPSSTSARRGVGLILLDSPGAGRVFYDSYDGHEVWINQSWSSVTVDVVGGYAQPRLRVRLTGSAALPVWNPLADRDEMMTVPTEADFTLSGRGSDWGINGWTLTTGQALYEKLRVGD